jgi:hypothetical protein
MKLTRFLISPLIALLVMTPVTMVTTGCPSVTSTQVQQDGATIAQAVENIAALIQTTNPTLAANLTKAAQALQQATANFQVGSGATIIIADSATAVEVALAALGPVCPECAVVAPLVPIAIAAIETLLNTLGVGAPAATAAVSSAASANLARLKGYKIAHRFGRSPEGDLTAAWNKTATMYPGLTTAVLK